MTGSQPRARGELINLVVAALGANQARGDNINRFQNGLTTAEVTKAVNAATRGPEVPRRVVLTILQRLRRDGRVRSERRGKHIRYLLTRNLERLQFELALLENEYGKVALEEFDRRVRTRRDVD